jgi:hypothetical protein
MSTLGHWSEEQTFPSFNYTFDPRTSAEINDPARHWLLVGNRRIQLCAVSDGGVGLYDESFGNRWLTDAHPRGTGFSFIEEDNRTTWGTDVNHWPSGIAPRRVFGPNSYLIAAHENGLDLERLILCPSGEVPWVLVRVRITANGRPRTFEHVEEWTIRPRRIRPDKSEVGLVGFSERTFEFEIGQSEGAIRVHATRLIDPLRRTEHGVDEQPGEFLSSDSFEAPDARMSLLLEQLDGHTSMVRADGRDEPRLEIRTRLRLEQDETCELWFRFGLEDGEEVEDALSLFEESMAEVEDRLPLAHFEDMPFVKREIAWHGAILTGGACRDLVIGGHTLNQGSWYSFGLGANAAARDPLQHALPLAYSEPDLALSVLRNTCAWSNPDGDLPFCLDRDKRTRFEFRQPSDQNLYALWLASEYAAATGDLDAFAKELAYHPSYGAAPTSLGTNLRRQFRFFVDTVGRGERGHVRMRHADWNDVILEDSGVDVANMTEFGGSVLNSAMAAWVLPVFAGLCERIDEPAMARESREIAEDLRNRVRAAWNGRWFDRAYAPGGVVVGGVDDLWLEVQPWAILCGAANGQQARELLKAIDEGPRSASPLGARLRWPVVGGPNASGSRGEGPGGGGIYPSVNFVLAWAAKSVDPKFALDEWRRMTPSQHELHYPDVWEGTVSGPDSYNAPESSRPGRTWPGTGTGGMQYFPVNNLHVHSQPILGYLRMLGVHPTSEGHLNVEGGGEWVSRTLTVLSDGHGSLLALGPVIIDTPFGEIRGGPGLVSW